MNLDQNHGLKLELIDWLVAKVTSRPACAGAAFEAILKLGFWRETARRIRAFNEPAFDVLLAFQSHWLTSGHTIREQIISDCETAKLLRHMMPRYEGCDKVLYRGESKWNWDNGQIGFCWTDKIEVAEMFAAGIHNSEHGAVVIRGNFPPSAIISGPEPNQSHTIRDEEREFTLDPFCEILVEAIRCHGPYDDTGNCKPEWPLPRETKRRCQR